MELDSTHLFITPDDAIHARLQQAIDDFHDSNSYKEDVDDNADNTITA